ncbi:MAG: rhodanese-like domain-containing protein [Pseudomonadota bacterium]
MDRLLEYLQHHPILVVLALAMAVAVLVFELRARRMAYAALRPQEAIQLMNQGAQLYDLRDAPSYAEGHINGAKHLDPAQQASAAEQLKRFKDRLLVVYCEDGARSASLTRQLHDNGFTKVFSLRGGLAAWRTEGLPLARG